jgi:hypothetical protein
MARFVVRVWLPDRPGALGAVASRIGAVRGDLVGIDILERGGGRAIDELVVELPDDGLVPLLLAEMAQVDGVDVEDVRPLARAEHDVRLDALESAALLVDQSTRAKLLQTLVEVVRDDFESEWVAVVTTDGEAQATVGEAPAGSWLSSFVAGASSSDVMAAGEAGPDDIATAAVGESGASLAVGRRGRPFRARERRQLGALARIAGSRWAQLAP